MKVMPSPQLSWFKFYIIFTGGCGWDGGGVFPSWIITAMLAYCVGVPLLQVMFSFKTHNVSETGFCLQVGPTQLGLISRAGSYLRTTAQK
jgi:hypothetical protein